MSDDGIRCIVTDRQALHAAVVQGYELVKRFVEDGRPVLVEIREAEEIRVRQRNFYHGYVLPTIADQVACSGRRYPVGVWKEHFRALHLGDRTVQHVNPVTSEVTVQQERVSSEEIGVRAYARFVDKVMVFAAVEGGVSWEYRDMREWETRGQMRRGG